MDTPQRLSGLSVALHWVVAALVMGLLAVGLYMTTAEAWHLYPLHKSIGIVALLVIVVRLAWRLKNGLPAPVAPMSALAHWAARMAHGGLLVLTLLLPLTGMLFSGASGHGFCIFSLELFPHRYSPGKPGEAVPFNTELADWGQWAHGALGYLLLGLVVLHVAAALKHHLIDRDATLRRMLGRTTH